MDFEEFQESDVMFSDYSSSSEEDQSVESDGGGRVEEERISKNNNMELLLEGSSSSKTTMLKRRKSLNKKLHKISSSLPIHIPTNSFRYDSDGTSPEPFDDDDFDDDDEDQMVRLPPHLIVERRQANKELARSLPVKERNLYFVRNCIIRMNDGLS